MTLALVTVCASVWAYDYNWASGNGEGSVYYKLNSPKAGEATVVAGEWQYRDNVTIPDNITIGSGPYAGTYKVTTIGKNAFYYCYDVISVTLGANVETIKSYAFERVSGPNGTGMVININSEKLTTIESAAFHCVTLGKNMGTDTLAIGKNVASLTGTSNYFSWVTFKGVNHYYVDPSSSTLSVDADGVLYNRNKTKLYLHPQPYFHDEFVIPSSVKIVASFAFYNMGYIETKDKNGKVISYQSLLRIKGGENVEKMGSVISGKYLETLPISAFIVGDNMETTALMYTGNYFMPTVDNSNPTFKLIDGVLYKYVGTDVILCYYFRSNTRSTFVIPEFVTKIAGYAFYSVSKDLRFIDYGSCNKLKSSDIAGTAFLSTSNELRFLNEDNLFKVRDGIMYTKAEGTKPDFYQMVLYPSNVDLEVYEMPAETKKVPRNVIKENGFVKTFKINSVLDEINTEHLYVMRKLEYYRVDPGNETYSSDEEGVLYNHDKTKLLAYPSSNERLFYKVADGTKQIGVAAFRENQYLKGLDLGDAITTLIDGNSNNLYDMKALNFIRVGTVQPPTVTTSTFSESMYKKGGLTTLYVPASAFEIYKKTSIWNRFNVVKDTGQFKSDVMEATFEYMVYHHKQNLAGDGYEVPETVTYVGNILKSTAAEPRVYEGFTLVPYSQKILDQRDLVVDIYYTRNSYNLEWKNNGTIISSGTYKYGTPIQVPNVEVVVPKGRHLVGWNTNPESLIAVNFDEGVLLRGNTTYHAIFADNDKKPYVVKHYQQNIDGSYPSEPTDVDDNYEASYGLMTEASAKSYPGFEVQPFEQQEIKQDGSTVIEIQYTRKNYTVTWKNGSTTVLSDSYPFGSELVVPADQIPVDGQHFVGWNTDSEATTALTVNGQTVPVDGVTYHAIFMKNGDQLYTVKHFKQNLDGESYPVTPSETETGSGTEGLDTQAAAKNYEGFTAQDFSQQKILSNNATVINIYYTRNNYTITWKKDSETLATNSNCLFGTAIQAPTNPTPAAGEHFVGWKAEGSATPILDFTEQTVPADNITYYAIFAENDTKKYKVRHYQEKLEGGYPAEPTAEEQGSGVFGKLTSASSREYTGFTVVPFDQKAIEEDESTVVEIFYTRNTHTITWHANGGTFSGTYTDGTLKYGAQIVAPNYSYTGHTFKRWGKTSNASSSEVIPATMQDEDLEYYAIWELNGYMTYWYWNFEGASDGGLFTTGTTKYGKPIEVTFGIPERLHYEFTGWSTTPTGPIITDNNYGIMDENSASFYAQWKPNEHTLTWDANGGVITAAGTSGLVAYGTSPLTPATVERTGYTLIGWGEKADATEVTNIQIAMPDEDKTYYAIWGINQYSISWNANVSANENVALTGDYTTGRVDYGTTIAKPNDPARHGYDFVGWNTLAEATTGMEISTMPANDLTLYAIWNPHVHNLKWYPNGGEFKVPDPSGPVAFGTPIEVPWVDRPGWKFSCWSNTPDGGAVTPEATMPDEDKTYYAIWIVKENYVTWKRNYSVDDDFNYEANNFMTNAVITPPQTNPTREHYQFAGWSAERDGDVITDNNYGIMDTDKKTFYAQWQLNQNELAWDANGGEIVTPGTIGMVEYGATVTEATVIYTGYEFVGWNTDPNATTTIDVTEMPDAPTTYYAVWTPKTYQVKWMFNNGTSEDFATNDVVFGNPIEAPITIPARTHYEFVGWAATPEGEELSDFGTLTTEGAIFYAQWQLCKYTLAWDVNGGQLSGDYTQGEVEYSAPIVAPTVTKANNTFAGWSTRAKLDSIVNVATMPDSNVTFVANWITGTNIVEWRMNDGTEHNYFANKVNLGDAITAPDESPERAYYQFLGWSLTPAGEVITDNEYGTMDENGAIFYAQWQINSHVLVWNANGGLLKGSYTSGSVEVGAEIVCPTAIRTGYTFVGWGTYAEAVDYVTISTMPDESIEYFAIWQVNSYAATWHFNADSVFATTQVNYSDSIKAPASPVRIDYLFTGWSDMAGGDVIDDLGIMPDNDVDFYAVWKIANKKVDWMFDADSLFLSTTVNIGETIVAPDKTPERRNFTFAGWSATTGGVAIEAFGVMQESDTTFFAAWEPILYNAVWHVNNGTADVFATTQASVNATLVVPDSVPSRQNYTFKGWSTAADGVPMSEIEMPEGGINLYAVWKPNDFTAIWKMNDGTDNNFETMEIEMGQAITAPNKKPARQYFNFVGWAKTAQGQTITDFGTMTANGAEFYAIWDAIVEFEAPAEFVTCERDEIIKLKALSNNQITFRWDVNGNVDSTQIGATFDIPDNAAVSGTITVTGSFGGKDVTKTITYLRKKMMIRTLWDDVITVVNPDTAFASYRWYHNDVLVDTTEYYNEVGGLTGKYYLVATTQSGVEICSCESDFGSAPEATMSVYPNPTVDDITVAGSLIEAGATISVIDGNGKVWLRKTIESDGQETIGVSQMPQGMYIVKVGDKVVSFIKL